VTTEPPWTVRLTASAEADFRDIIAWTAEEFGNRQAGIYAETLSAAIDSLLAGPTVVGARQRPEIGKGLFTLHVARRDHKGRHFVLFRAKTKEQVVEVLRLLHDAMDPKLHVPDT
jgi:toxin ParE1/3/4